MSTAELSFLVIDEQVFQRNVLVQTLRDLHAKFVLSAPSAREGLQMLKALPGPVDVVIADLTLGGLDTLELIRHVGAARHASALIITNTLERGVFACVEALSAACGIDLLAAADKPITGARLTEMIARHAPPAAARRIHSSETVFELDEIVEGLSNGEFEPFFQPKVDLKSGRVVGVEALARWRHPQQGIVLPEAFLGPLEAGGRIDMLLRSVLRQGAAFARGLREIGHDCTLSVNLTATSLRDLTIAEQISTLAASQGLEPRNLLLEVSEALATTASAEVLENLARLRLRGFGLAIDDYGRGLSSIEKLARIPFSEIKFDQPLLPLAERQTSSARLVLESSLDMARRLGLAAVAQGVETQADWDLLVQLRCDMAQGDYVAKPMARASFTNWIREWSAPGAR